MIFILSFCLFLLFCVEEGSFARLFFFMMEGGGGVFLERVRGKCARFGVGRERERERTTGERVQNTHTTKTTISVPFFSIYLVRSLSFLQVFFNNDAHRDDRE